MSSPFKLLRLQQIDTQLDSNSKRLDEIAYLLKQDEALRNAQKISDQAEVELSEKRKALSKAEENVKSQRMKIEGTESTLYGGSVTNPKELQDLENEAASLKRYLAVLEERLLEAMLEEDDAAESFEQFSTILEKERSRFAKLEMELNKEQSKIEDILIRVHSERQAARKSIPQEEYQVYDKLRSEKHGIAVTKVSDNACSACGSMLNAALLHKAKSPNSLTQCDTCRRILYSG